VILERLTRAGDAAGAAPEASIDAAADGGEAETPAAKLVAPKRLRPAAARRQRCRTLSSPAIDPAVALVGELAARPDDRPACDGSDAQRPHRPVMC